MRTHLPLYACSRCAGRAWWRLPPGPWQCSGCRPWWGDAVVIDAIETGPAGVRPALAYADAAIVAAEHAELCASQRRFLAAAAARA